MGSPVPPGRRRRVWAVFAIAALVSVGVYLGAELYMLDGRLGFPLDDSFIHLVFARSLASGEGLAFQGSALVTGSTAPLWTGLLSLVFLLPGSPVLWAKLFGFAAHLASGIASFALARALGVGRVLAMAAGLVVLFTGWLAWSALGAMEVGLFATLSLIGMLAHLAERARPSRPPLSLGLFAVAVLLRPEGLLLLCLAVLDRFLPRRREGDALVVSGSQGGVRRILGGLALAGLALVPVALFYRVVGGSWLPTTFATKMSYGSGIGWPSRGYLTTVTGILFQAQPVAALLAPAGALVLLRRLGGERDRGLLPALWLLGLPLAYGVLGAGRTVVGNFGRYYFPLFPVLIVLAALAIRDLAETLPLRLSIGSRRVRWAPLAGAVLLAPSVFAWVQGAGRYTQSVLNVEDSDVRMARWIATNVSPDAVLAVNDIGAFGWYLDNRLVDLAGIATPEVHRYVRAALARGETTHVGVLDFVRQIRPDYLVVFPEWFGPVLATGEFEPLATLEIPGNITMGGDRVVLYATPWTRARPGPPAPPPEPPS